MIERKYKNGDKVLYMHQEECIVTDAHYMVYPKHEAWEYYIKNENGVFKAIEEECIVTDAHYMVYPKHEAWEYYIKNENGVFKAIEEELELVVDNSTTEPKKSRRNKNRKK